MGRSDRGAVLLLSALALGLALAMPVLAETLKTLAPSKPAPAGERRIALVIGNSAYKDSPLRNPANDARAISLALSATGFTVTVIEDATQITMRRAVRNFGDELAKATVGLFYYAGHGMQVKGANYLIPVNADIEREDEVADQAIDANFILTKMDSAKNALNIMILDACRNNPFARSFRSGSKGLAQMDAPSGTLISFATAPGSVASDGSGQNGLYTEHFLKAMHAPGMPIEQVFKQVRIGVTGATKDQQIPWESSSLKGDFSFVPGVPLASAASTAAASQEAMQRAVQEATRAAEERAAKAVAEATRSADERAARERDAMQKRMEQMVADMLAKQKAMLDAERSAQGGASPAPAPAQVARPAPPAAAPAAPIQIASAAPTPVASATSAAPALAMGDRWRYVGVDAFNASKKYEALVEVLGATAAGVIESTSEQSGRAREWVYTNAPTLVGAAGVMAVFSPLVGMAQALQVGQTWRSIAIERVGQCGSRDCTAEAKVEAFEKVTTLAGSFDAYRVELNIVNPSKMNGGRGELIYWYSPQAKRIVKYKARTRGPFGLPDIDSELVAYQMAGQAAVGTMPDALLAAASAKSEGVLVATTGPIAGINVGGASVPKVGDRWEYTDTASGRPVKRTVEVTQVSGGLVRERVSGEGMEALSIDHSGGAYLVGAGMIQFSPYLLAFGNPTPGTRLGDVRNFNVPGCTACTLSAQVVGTEKVTVPAGTFDAVKLEVSYSADAQRGTLTYWYAPAARRMVKAQSQIQAAARVFFTGIGMSNHQIELVSLKLQQ
jgi:uncharacterized caspase-like protein